MVSPLSGLGTPAEPVSPPAGKSAFKDIPAMTLGTPARVATPEIKITSEITKDHHHDEDI